MKKHIAVLVAALIAAVSLTGCATNGTTSTTTPEQKAARLQTVAEVAAFSGASVWLKKHADDRPAFEAAHAALSVLVAGSAVSPVQVSEALAGLPIKELKGEEGAIYVGIATIVYDAYLRENVNLDGEINVKAFVTGLHAGLNRALLLTATPPPAQ